MKLEKPVLTLTLVWEKTLPKSRWPIAFDPLGMEMGSSFDAWIGPNEIFNS